MSRTWSNLKQDPISFPVLNARLLELQPVATLHLKNVPFQRSREHGPSHFPLLQAACNTLSNYDAES